MTVVTEVSITGPSPLIGRLRVPGDKSISHRALLFAAVGHGPSRLTGLSNGEDVGRTAAALEQLGVKLRRADGVLTVRGGGFDGLAEPEGVVDCGNSGTTTRLLAGILAGRPFHTIVAGDASLSRRPMLRVVEPLRLMGARIDGRRDGDLLPLAFRGGGLTGRRFELPMASAQVKSALLLAGLQADGITEVTEPAPSRDHTERFLPALGAPLTLIPGGARVEAADGLDAFQLDIPGDPSSAAFFVVGACITPGSDLVVEGVCLNPGRIGFVEVLRRMGAKVDVEVTGERAGEPVGNIHAEYSALRGTSLGGAEIPSLIDEIPVLAVAAAFAEGVTEIRDAEELRAKETDRIGTVSQELSQLGVRVESRYDGMVIHGGSPRPGLLKSHGDHRVAMAAAVAANACDGASTIRGWQAVGVSYPGFGADLSQVTGQELEAGPP